jgi:hypothetical protein
MANTLTNLIPDAYAALDIVSRELSGFIPSVLRDSSANQIGISQTLRVPIVPTATVSTISPAMSLPAAVDQTISSVSVTMSKQREAKFSWTGSEQKSINTGAGYATIKQLQIAQAIRSLVNEMETDLAAAAILGSSRAYGTAATTPFGTANDYTDAANLGRILTDNGAPMDRQLVISTAAGVNLRGKQATSQNATTDDILRQGVLLDINGMKIRESYALGASFTKGTGASYVLNGAHAVGATSITVKTGTGTVLVGDVVTINSRHYVVSANAIAAAGTFTINAPGLVDAGSDGNAVTLIATNSRAGVAFDRSSLLLATRLPDFPEEGDIALMRDTITDPRTGLSFEVSAVGGDRMVTFRVGAVWGVAAIKPAHSALLIG